MIRAQLAVHVLKSHTTKYICELLKTAKFNNVSIVDQNQFHIQLFVLVYGMIPVAACKETVIHCLQLLDERYMHVCYLKSGDLELINVHVVLALYHAEQV